MEGVELVDLTWTPTPHELERGQRMWRRPVIPGLAIVGGTCGLLVVATAQLARTDRVLLAVGAGTLGALLLPVAAALVATRRRRHLAAEARPMRVRIIDSHLEVTRGSRVSRVPVREVPPPRRSGGIVVLDLAPAVVIPEDRVDPAGLAALLARLAPPDRRGAPEVGQPDASDPYAPPGTLDVRP